MGSDALEKLFNPSAIAVFGASDSMTSVGSLVFHNLINSGFDGPVVPLNPKYQTVAGRRCYTEIFQVEEPIDLAVIATPARTVARIIGQCCERGIGHGIILSAGFGEAGESGRKFESEIAELAEERGFRFIGPNCVGLVRPWIGMNATFLKSATPKGKLALVSQSGALCSAISDWAEPNHLGFSALVSVGNSTDTGFGDILRFLADDAKTSAILLYVEGVRDARSFVSGLRMAARKKPVIVLKSGRQSQGSKAASTHTGALMGSDDVFAAVLERCGAVRVNTFAQLFAAAEILSATTRMGGKRLAIVTNGGGAGVLAADRAGELGLELPPPSEQTLATLNETLAPFWSKANPLDILGDARPEHYGEATKAALDDDAYDGVLVMLTPQAMTDALAAARALVAAIPPQNKKPVLCCWMGEASVNEARDYISSSGIPDFHTPERAVEAFHYLARHQRNTRLAQETPAPPTHRQTAEPETVRKIVDQALAQGREMLSDTQSKSLLRHFNIPVNETVETFSQKAAVEAAKKIGYPVAVKILSPDISHKSDVGGVRINVMDDAGVKKAWREIRAGLTAARPDAKFSGVTVEPMIRLKHARELVIGASRDPVFGPTILFGAGGKLVELLKDNAVALPPLNEVLAGRLISRTRVHRLLDAFRDLPAADREAIIDVLMRVSDMICEIPEIEELDINPLLAGPQGVMAVDARVKIVARPSTSRRYAHMAIEPGVHG